MLNTHMNMIQTKTCRECQETKPIGEFYKRTSSPDGHRNECKECRKKYNTRLEEEQLCNVPSTLTCRKCQEELPISSFGKVKTGKYGRRPDCKKCQCEYTRTYYEQNKDRIGYNRKQYLKRRGYRIAREYVKNNRHIVNSRNAAYRAAKKEQTPPHINIDKIRAIYEQAVNMTKQTGECHHVDHIIPISAGGNHSQENLRVITQQENQSKSSSINIQDIEGVYGLKWEVILDTYYQWNPKTYNHLSTIEGK